MKTKQWNSHNHTAEIKRMRKSEDSLRALWDNIKWTNIHNIEIPEEEREKGAEISFEEIMAENFPVLGRKQTFRFRKHTRVPNKMNQEIHNRAHFDENVKN